MSNNLDSFIFDPIKRNGLDWRRRLHIIQGIAQGLVYLHQYSRVRIIHRDMKPSNILLDSDMNPKIIFGGNNSEAKTKRMVGTVFGVLVLEIVSGKRNTRSCNLLDHAWNLWKDDKGLELLDPILGQPSSISTPLRYIHVALLCVQDNADDRPTMSGVITMLNNESMILPFSKNPTGRLVDRNSDMDMPLIHSINGATLSMMDAC